MSKKVMRQTLLKFTSSSVKNKSFQHEIKLMNNDME